MELRDYILKLIGSDLRALGATDFKESADGVEEVFLFSIGDRRVAIPYSPRNGMAGYISEGKVTDDVMYVSWQTIYSFAGIPEAQDFDQLDKIIDQLPDNNDDIIRFIGATLKDRLA